MSHPMRVLVSLCVLALVPGPVLAQDDADGTSAVDEAAVPMAEPGPAVDDPARVEDAPPLVDAPASPEPAPADASVSDGGDTTPRVRRSMRVVRAPVALGLELGEASGLSVGYRIRDAHQINGLVGFSPWFQSLVLRTDYAYHFLRWVPSRDYGVALSFFGGGGLRLGVFEPRPSYLRELPFAFGARAPVGVRATLPPLPVELDLTLAPGVDVAPELRFRMEGGLALRFHVDLLSGQTW
ncbi:MAG: hypothetical protein ABIJ09_05410 [Pseudomonadota bacterium]